MEITDRCALSASIKEAWENMPRPRTILVDASEDENELSQFFTTDVLYGHSAADLGRMSAAFTFFTPEAWRYWVATFMECALRGDGDMDVSIDRLAESF
jgi:hypothetical protein